MRALALKGVGELFSFYDRFPYAQEESVSAPMMQQPASLSMFE